MLGHLSRVQIGFLRKTPRKEEKDLTFVLNKQPEYICGPSYGAVSMMIETLIRRLERVTL